MGRLLGESGRLLGDRGRFVKRGGEGEDGRMGTIVTCLARAGVAATDDCVVGVGRVGEVVGLGGVGEVTGFCGVGVGNGLGGGEDTLSLGKAVTGRVAFLTGLICLVVGVAGRPVAVAGLTGSLG